MRYWNLCRNLTPLGFSPRVPRKALAAFLARRLGEERARLWQPEELGAIFRHQMSAPILVDLGGFDPVTAARLRTLSQAQSLLLKDFLDPFSTSGSAHRIVDSDQGFRQGQYGSARQQPAQ